MGMFGTCSMVISAVASSTASEWRSANVPAAAYTSIIGIRLDSFRGPMPSTAVGDLVLCASPGRRRRADLLGGSFDQLRDLAGARDHRDVTRRDLHGGRAHPRRELALGVRRDRFVV